MEQPMFDKDSFTDEITNAAQANSGVQYLSHNERNFRKELMAEGLTHEQEEHVVQAVWMNLLNACKRVGFSDTTTKEKAEQFGIKA